MTNSKRICFLNDGPYPRPMFIFPSGNVCRIGDRHRPDTSNAIMQSSMCDVVPFSRYASQVALWASDGDECYPYKAELIHALSIVKIENSMEDVYKKMAKNVTFEAGDYITVMQDVPVECVIRNIAGGHDTVFVHPLGRVLDPVNDKVIVHEKMTTLLDLANGGAKFVRGGVGEEMQEHMAEVLDWLNHLPPLHQ